MFWASSTCSQETAHRVKLLKYKRSAITTQHFVVSLFITMAACFWNLHHEIFLKKINKAPMEQLYLPPMWNQFFLKQIIPFIIIEKKILTQPSNDVGGSKSKERKALSVATLGGNPV